MDTPVSDFDGAWKEALERFFEPFLAFFFPQVHAGIDWTQPVVFQDTALQQVAPEETQGKQHVDKLVRVVRRDGTATWLLIHIEIQSRAPCKVVSVALPVGSQAPTLAWA
jgi:hypothetical protein